MTSLEQLINLIVRGLAGVGVLVFFLVFILLAVPESLWQ